MDKEKILNIIKKCSTFDVDGNVKYVDVLEYDMLANKLLEAINVIRCCKSDSDVVADIRNKLGSVTALIDLIKLRKTEHADYAESKLDAQILQAIESIQYIKQL